MKFLGIDIGGTKIEVALVSFSGRSGTGSFRAGFGTPPLFGQIVAQRRAPTHRIYGYENAVCTIEDLSLAICRDQAMGINDINGIGISLPGTVHPGSRQMLMGNTAMFIGKDIVSDIRTKLKTDKPVACDNDANCFAYAEAMCGAGVAYQTDTGVSGLAQTAIGVILGTGVGGGIVINGSVARGKYGGAGEIGHTELFTHGHPCYCGRNGCAEQYLSGPAMEAAFSNRLYSQIPKRPSTAEIFALAEKLDPIAIAVVKQYQRHLAKFLANLTRIFDPHYFVLGGGMSNPPVILDGLAGRIHDTAFVPRSDPRVYRHCLGDSAGVIGCVLMVLRRAD